MIQRCFQRIGSLVPQVLATLMNCFKDPSWSVRDAACSGKKLFIQVTTVLNGLNFIDLFPVYISLYIMCCDSNRFRFQSAVQNLTVLFAWEFFNGFLAAALPCRCLGWLLLGRNHTCLGYSFFNRRVNLDEATLHWRCHGWVRKSPFHWSIFLHLLFLMIIVDVWFF